MLARPALVADLSDEVPVARTLTAADVAGLAEELATYQPTSRPASPGATRAPGSRATCAAC